ncbi:MAG: ABC transporter permease [Chloroflexaceae bacterium]|nr:ABC transporter permease [Chloroflexaceae bacterium]
MQWFILWRLITALPLLLVVSVLIFLLLHLIPGSAAVVILGEAASPERIAALETELGLNDPLYMQYGRWISHALQGDLGNSMINGRPVVDALSTRLPVTLSLAAGGLCVSVFFGITLGILAGAHPGSVVDRFSVFIASLGLALPAFWLAILLSSWFAIELGWFPAVGYTPFRESPIGWLHSLVLPSLALGLPSSAFVTRQMRSSLRGVLQTPYIRAARATGVGGWSLIWRHALRNALIPVITIIGFEMTRLVGGAFLVEQVFALPGMGSLMINAVLERDIPTVQGIILVIACLVIAINVLVDISYGWLNPRVRLA